MQEREEKKKKKKSQEITILPLCNQFSQFLTNSFLANDY